MSQPPNQLQRTYVHGQRLIVAVRDLMVAPTQGIVSPANGGLSPGGGLAEQVLREGGPELEAEFERIIRARGEIPTTQAVLTGSGRLPYEGILHAVGPRVVEDEVEQKLTATFANCLTLASSLGWESIAFPAISTGNFAVPRKICAVALDAAVERYFLAESTVIEEIWLCLTLDAFEEFATALRASVDQYRTPVRDELEQPIPGVVEVDEDELADISLKDFKFGRDEDV